MKHKLLKFSIILIIGFSLIEVNGQESLVSAGGNNIGSGGDLSYSVGQIVFTTNVGEGGFEAQGVQQAFEISVTLNVDESLTIELGIQAFPNPTSDVLTLQIANTNLSGFSYVLYDLNGKLLQNMNLNSDQTLIGMKDLVSATYFLKVFQGNKTVKIFKIIKN